MKNKIYLLLVFILGAYSCNNDCQKGDGEDIYMEEQVEDFNHIQLRIAAKLFLAPDTAIEINTIEVSGKETTVNNIVVTSNNGLVAIDFKDCIDEHGDIRAIVHYNPLYTSQLTVENVGSGIIESSYALKHSEVILNNSGAGKIDVSILSDSINSMVTGSGKIIISGGTNLLKAELTSSGDISAFELGATNSVLHLTSFGNVETTTSDQLDIFIGGSGDVYYKGNPDIDSEITGSGQIYNRN